MTVFIAALATETNTFSSIPTGRKGFEETGVYHGDATSRTPFLFSEPLRIWRDLAEKDGLAVIESLCAAAQPAGRTVARVYHEFRDEIIGDLSAARPGDIILLMMHGAMVAVGEDDCEGDILTRLRKIVGPDVAIGVELDLHCHLTRRMAENATAIVTFKEYPHIDGRERAAELFRICSDAAAGKTSPHISLSDCRMVSMWRTPVEPMKSFVERMKSLEGHNGVLSVSFGHGFPWGDVADVGAKMLVVTDGDAARGDALSENLAREIWDMRDTTADTYSNVDASLERALAATSSPVVLADVADNAGGGAPGDSTFLLREILDRGIVDATLGFYWDPVAVHFCQEAGEGAEFEIRVGGKCGPFSGDPVDAHVTVKKIVQNASQPFGTSTTGMGDSVWISTAGINLVLCSTRTQVFHPDGFTQFGIDLTEEKIIVVKSSQHFYAGFAPLAAEIVYVTTPGAINPDFANINYTKRTTSYWPKTEDPF